MARAAPSSASDQARLPRHRGSAESRGVRRSQRVRAPLFPSQTPISSKPRGAPSIAPALRAAGSPAASPQHPLPPTRSYRSSSFPCLRSKKQGKGRYRGSTAGMQGGQAKPPIRATSRRDEAAPKPDPPPLLLPSAVEPLAWGQEEQLRPLVAAAPAPAPPPQTPTARCCSWGHPRGDPRLCPSASCGTHAPGTIPRGAAGSGKAAASPWECQSFLGYF